VRRGRKATGLKEIAGLPGFGREAGLPWKQGGLAFLGMVQQRLNNERKQQLGGLKWDSKNYWFLLSL
jgi:hypothetical protein